MSKQKQTIDNTEILSEVSSLVKFASENKLSELELETEKFSLKVKKHIETKPTVVGFPFGSMMSNFDDKDNESVDNEESVSKPEYDPEKVVVSPLAGIFYRSKSPTSSPFVKEGDYVSKGSVIGIVSACKNHNEIISDKSGKVAKFFVDSEDNIARGDKILLLE